MISGFEGYRARAYNDSGGNATIGYGHLLHLGPATWRDRGLFWPEPYARRRLRQDCATAEAAVRRLVTRPLGQGQYDALVSFTFNVGTGGFGRSTLLRDVNRHLGPKGSATLRADFERWSHVDGRVVPGLLRRRQAEAELYLQGRYPVT